MTKGLVALIREQGVELAVVNVKASVINGPRRAANELVAAFSLEFEVPTVLVAQDSRGEATYYGRPDLSKWLANNVLSLEQLPWREFTLRAA
jgi:hypothetical protein